MQGRDEDYYDAPPFRFHRHPRFAGANGNGLHRAAAEPSSCCCASDRSRSHANCHGITHGYAYANRPAGPTYLCTAVNPCTDTHCCADTFSHNDTDGQAGSHTDARRYSGAHTYADIAPDSIIEANWNPDTVHHHNRSETRRLVGGEPPSEGEPTQSVALVRRRRGPLRA